MNVLLLCLSPGCGGLELHVLHEMRFLTGQGHSCLAVTRREGLLASRLDEHHLQQVHLKTKNRVLPLLAARKLAQLIDQHQIDVVHAHWAKDLNLAALAKAFSHRKPRLVFTRHMELTRSKKDWAHRWFYQQVDTYLCVSSMVEAQAHKYLDLKGGEIKLWHIGVAAPTSAPDCEQFFREYGIKQRTLNLAILSRIEAPKGQHLVLDAVAQLCRQGVDVSLTIIGHVVDQAYGQSLIEKVTQEKLEGHVTFVPFLKNPIDCMPCFDVIVLASRMETFGLVLVEAMRAGVAVIGTGEGGVLDIIDPDKTGLFADSSNSASFVSAIERLYEQPDLRQLLARQGKQKADECFNDVKQFRKLEKILMDLVAV